MILKHWISKAVLGGVMLLGGIVAAGAPAQAQYYRRPYYRPYVYRTYYSGRSCRAAYFHERADMNRAIRRYGYYSAKAREEARELRNIERRCGYY